MNSSGNEGLNYDSDHSTNLGALSARSDYARSEYDYDTTSMKTDASAQGGGPGGTGGALSGHVPATQTYSSSKQMNTFAALTALEQLQQLNNRYTNQSQSPSSLYGNYAGIATAGGPETTYSNSSSMKSTMRSTPPLAHQPPSYGTGSTSASSSSVSHGHQKYDYNSTSGGASGLSGADGIANQPSYDENELIQTRRQQQQFYSDKSNSASRFNSSNVTDSSISPNRGGLDVSNHSVNSRTNNAAGGNHKSFLVNDDDYSYPISHSSPSKSNFQSSNNGNNGGAAISKYGMSPDHFQGTRSLLPVHPTHSTATPPHSHATPVPTAATAFTMTMNSSNQNYDQQLKNHWQRHDFPFHDNHHVTDHSADVHVDTNSTCSVSEKHRLLAPITGGGREYDNGYEAMQSPLAPPPGLLRANGGGGGGDRSLSLRDPVLYDSILAVSTHSCLSCLAVAALQYSVLAHYVLLSL